jgi:hypothetical protein
MEEMAVHTLKKMTGDKEKLKFCKGETSGVQFAAVKIEYPADSSLQQDAGDFGPDPEQYSDGISPNAGLPSRKFPDEIKPEIKVNISGIQGSTKESHGEGLKQCTGMK